MYLFHPGKVGLLFRIAVPLVIISIIMVTQDTVYTQRGLYFIKYIHVLLHFAGHIIHQVTREKDQVGLLIQNFLHPPHDSIFIGKTATMNIRDVNDPEAFESSRKIAVRKFYPP